MDSLETNLDFILKELKSRNALPKKFEVAQFGERHWIVNRENDAENIISETSSTGFSEHPTIALLKSLSERIERLAFRDGHKNSLPSCLTERSDGFAAYPRFYEKSEEKARQSALSEAIERYVWATWWDNHEIEFDFQTIDQFQSKSNFNLDMHIKLIKKHCEIEEIFVIQPKIQNSNNHQVIILFARLRFPGGFISGGACGDLSQEKETLLRAFDELYRHGLAIKKVRKQELKPQSFYEERLVYFGFGKGNLLIRSRLESKGKKSITLPNLKIDEVIPHSFEDLFCVHRCLFEEQPPFIGGLLERFCL